MVKWFKQFDWAALAMIGVVAAVGGIVGGAGPLYFFMRGVCW